ncbi:sensor histidine kinase [Enterococcus sp. LJL51]|uniref:sensor histidine kinase n=1 Tax=Enterococcus sp. LJL51 TaxID=3416656 RepID=UPI003CF2A08B
MTMYLAAAGVILGVGCLLYLAAYRRKMNQQLEQINRVLANLASEKSSQQKIILAENEQLADIAFSINQLNAQKNERIYELEQIEQSQKSFLSHLSHDIRTPLTSLIGYLEALEGGYLDEQKLMNEYLPLILKKAQQMQRLTDQIFLWFKLEDSKETPVELEERKPFDLGELTREIAAQWIPLFEKAEINYQIDIPEEAVYLSLDELAYTRVMENLLKNCLMHSQATALHLYLKEDEKTVYLGVQDNGIGISSKDLPFIFQKLYKCDPARSASSSGLGLAITKELVSRMNGDIKAVSEAGLGSLFEVCLSKDSGNTDS